MTETAHVGDAQSNRVHSELEQETDAPPPGFKPLTINEGFIGRNGPLYARRDGDEVVFGFRVRQHHCNPMGVCHGGWMATVCDMVLPLSARLLTGLHDQFLLTVHLGIEYLAPAPLGAWVEGHGRLLRRTGRMVFADATLQIEDQMVVRASGIFRPGPPAPHLVIG